MHICYERCYSVPVMRYMIAHMLSGDAKKYHENLSNILAQAYRLRPVTANIDSHLTFKAPFDALSSDLPHIEKIIQECTQHISTSSYIMHGFGSFDDRVLYMDVHASEEMNNAIQYVKERLAEVPWLEFKPHEKDTKTHATLCYPKNAEQTGIILSRLLERNAPTFTCTFDTLALLKKGERRFEIMREFSIGDNSWNSVL